MSKYQYSHQDNAPLLLSGLVFLRFDCIIGNNLHCMARQSADQTRAAHGEYGCHGRITVVLLYYRVTLLDTTVCQTLSLTNAADEVYFWSSEVGWQLVHIAIYHRLVAAEGNIAPLLRHIGIIGGIKGWRSVETKSTGFCRRHWRRPVPKSTGFCLMILEITNIVDSTLDQYWLTYQGIML